ncbi:MAG: AraC family transcriptional regulator [Steroidobacteraceae bacterium]|nr:AraC family transcriptional regulator [Steroidobacteraceae bacterium]
MAITPWRMVSKIIGVQPVVSADVGRRYPVRVERYLFQARRQRIPALPNAVLIVHLGGARVSGGRLHGRPASYVPSFAVFLAAGCASQWLLEGAVDVAGFYLPPTLGDRLARQVDAATGGSSEFQFTDALVTAAALQIVEELRRGPDADGRFLDELARVLFRQTERVLAGRGANRMSPAPTQLSRLKSALDWIDRHLGAEITNAALARHVGLGESHFRHVFAAAFGVPPSLYVRQRRLERARELLALTSRPIAHIASDCGFASQSHLTTCFKARHGVTPARFRRALLGKKGTQPAVAARERS